MRMLRFNEEYQVLVDEQGLMLPTSDALALVEQLRKHLSHSVLELEAIGRRTVEENHPRMVNQFNFDYFQ